MRPGSDSGLGLGLGFGLGFGFGLAVRLGFGLAVRLGVRLLLGRLAGLVLEIGRVPAAALELKARRAHQLLERRLVADRALRERRLAALLQELFLVAAGLATVFVNRHAAIISLISERNIVFQVVELAGRLLRRRGPGLGRLRLHRRLGARLARPGARAQHLHLGGHDLGGVLILALLVLPFAGAQAPFHIHLRPLLEVFRR